jgi:hypothetical protein
MPKYKGVQVLLVVCARIEVHGKEVLRWNSGAGGIQLQFADGDAGAICPEVAKSEDASAIGHTDEPYVFLRPVLQDVFYMATPRHR